VVESQPSKLLVAGSIPVSRSTAANRNPQSPIRNPQFVGLADVAQLAERVLGKDEVTGSIPVIGSSLRSRFAHELRLASQPRIGTGNADSSNERVQQRTWAKKNLIGPSRT
jgi:hypothetical protein